MCASGVWRAGLPRGLSPQLGSPWWDPCYREGRYVWCLRNPTWLVGKARRQEARSQDRRGGLAYHHGGGAGLAQLPYAHGGSTLPTSGWGLPELISAEDISVESLSPWWVVLGLTGEGASTGEFRFMFRCLLLLFLTWGEGAQRPAWEHQITSPRLWVVPRAAHHDLQPCEPGGPSWVVFHTQHYPKNGLN